MMMAHFNWNMDDMISHNRRQIFLQVEALITTEIFAIVSCTATIRRFNHLLRFSDLFMKFLNIFNVCWVTFFYENDSHISFKKGTQPSWQYTKSQRHDMRCMSEGCWGVIFSISYRYLHLGLIYEQESWNFWMFLYARNQPMLTHVCKVTSSRDSIVWWRAVTYTRSKCKPLCYLDLCDLPKALLLHYICMFLFQKWTYFEITIQCQQ